MFTHLGNGEYESGEYKRVGRGGREVWLRATYNPIMDLEGRPYKVVKYALDVTESKLTSAEYEGKVKVVKGTLSEIRAKTQPVDGKSDKS